LRLLESLYKDGSFDLSRYAAGTETPLVWPPSYSAWERPSITPIHQPLQFYRCPSRR
jgi:hypothetical protein